MTYDDVQKSFTFDVKRDVFYDNSGGYNLVFGTLIERGDAGGGVDLWEGRGTSARRKIRIVRGRECAIVSISSTAIEPLL